jgi:hypothetical protein
MGRFHYWLGTGQVTRLRPVLHRPPILYNNSLFYSVVTYSHSLLIVSSILTYQNLTNAVPFSYGVWYLWVICCNLPYCGTGSSPWQKVRIGFHMTVA